MAKKITIDPITRIEGHLAIDVEIENGVVKDAWSRGTMFRGMEILLKGKDPRDASYVTDRVCGVCTGSHNWASSLALDDAFGATVPKGGRLLRHLILGSIWLHDHPLHFYHLSALDYIDVMAVAQYKGNDEDLNRVKDKIVKLVQAGDPAPLIPRYKPDEFCVTDPEIVTSAVKHYIDALHFQALAKKMAAIFAGKVPHNSAIVVGGVTKYPNPQDIQNFISLFQQVKKFVTEVYVPDVLAFGTGPLLPLAQAGVGGFNNFMSYGGFQMDDAGTKLLFDPGVVIGGDLNNIKGMNRDLIAEEVKYAWYKDEPGRHPFNGATDFVKEKKDAYTWLKAPRYDGLPMEVGPLARMMIMKHASLMKAIETHGIKPGAVARHAARALETLMIVDAMEQWIDELWTEMGSGQLKVHDTDNWEVPKEAQGAGLNEAPRGALGHWINIKDHKIENYQMVVPSTWNQSPRDDRDVRGPMEESLIGCPVPDPDNPINVARIVRSFDPCLSCAVHIIHPDTNEIKKFRVV